MILLEMAGYVQGGIQGILVLDYKKLCCAIPELFARCGTWSLGWGLLEV